MSGKEEVDVVSKSRRKVMIGAGAAASVVMPLLSATGMAVQISSAQGSGRATKCMLSFPICRLTLVLISILVSFLIHRR